VGTPVRGIQVDQDQPRLRARELREGPFGAVGRPDSYSVTGLEIQVHKSGGELINSKTELRIGPSNTLMPNDERIAPGMDGGCVVQGLPDGFVTQRLGIEPVNEAGTGSAHDGPLLMDKIR
jgi:hypothetical protein